MKWFRKEIQIIEKKFEIPEDVVQAIEATEDGGTAKRLFIEYLKTLDRVDFLRAGDAYQKIWDKDHEMRDWLWEAYNDVEWGLEFPQTKQLYDLFKQEVYENMPIIYTRKKDKNGREQDLDLNELVKQITGMQKKLDKVETLISSAEFKLCGKDALKL